MNDARDVGVNGLGRDLIRRTPPSKRSTVNQFQTQFLALLIERLERAVLLHFHVSERSKIPLDRFAEVFSLEEYQLFLEGAYACGFVCCDFKMDGPIVEAKSRPEETISTWSFFKLRHYVHTVVRGERWADHYSSPILEAIAAGALQHVARRLRSSED